MLTLTQDGSRTSPPWASSSCVDLQPHSQLWLCPTWKVPAGQIFFPPSLFPLLPLGSAWKIDEGGKQISPNPQHSHDVRVGLGLSPVGDSGQREGRCPMEAAGCDCGAGQAGGRCRQP